MYDRRGKSRLIEFIKASIAFKYSDNKITGHTVDIILTEEIEGLQEALSKANMQIEYVEHKGKLTPCVQRKKLELIYVDELTEEPRKVYNKQYKKKAQWKREISPCKH